MILVLSVSKNNLSAQEPPHPPSSGHGQNGNQPPPGGGAPIDGGISILLALGAAYGMRKVIKPVK